MHQKHILEGIPGFDDWTEITTITKGRSSDKKFKVKTSSNQYFIVRLSDKSHYALKKIEFDAVKKLTISHLNITHPINFGLTSSKEHVFMIYTWVEGDDAQEIIPTMDSSLQYAYGREAGWMLREIHSINAPSDQEPWEPKFRRKVENRLQMYKEGNTRLNHEARVIEFLYDNLYLLKNRPQTLQHGDYHLGNMVVSPSRNKGSKYSLGLIDFNRLSYGDPLEEFERWVFTVKSSIPFMNGQIHSYFGDKVPEVFFRLMAVYTAYSIIGSIPWAEPFGIKEVENMLELANSVINMYDGFRSFVPKWYEMPNNDRSISLT